MIKCAVAFTVDPEIWEIVKLKYPRKVSGMVNQFLKDLADQKVNEEIDLDKQKDKLEQQISKLNNEKNIIIAKIKLKEKEIDDEEMERIASEAETFRRTNPLRYL